MTEKKETATSTAAVILTIVAIAIGFVIYKVYEYRQTNDYKYSQCMKDAAITNNSLSNSYLQFNPNAMQQNLDNCRTWYPPSN